MDLWAYANIGNVESVAKDNGISVPRLRGLRLMGDETDPLILTKEEKKQEAVRIVEKFCQNGFGRFDWYEYSSYTRYLKDYYLIKDGGKKYKDINWSRIHGWKRKNVKFAIKKKLKRIQAQNDVWNKYLGREDILYVHARIGGGNWPTFYKEVVSNPRFLEKVDDAYDDTYCDLYFKIEEK